VPETEREQAHARFQQAQDAYDILKDPEQRVIYDDVGLEGMKRGAGAGGAEGAYTEADLQDMLNQMFGGGGPGGGPGGSFGKRTPDAIEEYEVTLEELYKGKQVKFVSKRKVVCTTCKGYFYLASLYRVPVLMLCV